MKDITKKQYDRLIRLKQMYDRLATLQEDYYQNSIEILGCEEDNGWFVDYFYNSSGKLDDLLNKLEIAVDDNFVGDRDHEHDGGIL